MKPYRYRSSPLVRDIPSLTLLNLIHKAFPNPDNGQFKGTHALTFKDGELHVLVWFIGVDGQVRQQRYFNILNDTWPELRRDIQMGIDLVNERIARKV